MNKEWKKSFWGQLEASVKTQTPYLNLVGPYFHFFH